MSHETASAGVDERLVLETAMEAGHILLENGAEISRVEETMDRICQYFGVERRDFFVLSNGIFTTGGQERGENAQPFAHIVAQQLNIAFQYKVRLEAGFFTQLVNDPQLALILRQGADLFVLDILQIDLPAAGHRVPGSDQQCITVFPQRH